MTTHREIFRVLVRTLLHTVRRRPWSAFGLCGWSLLGAVPALVYGQAVAHAVDAFRMDAVPRGIAWLALLAAAAPVGALGNQRIFGSLAAIVEPFRDDLAHWVVRGSVHRSLGGRPDTGGVARLTHQVEIVRDTLAGMLLVVLTFAMTATSALIGLLSLMPLLLALVLPPLIIALAFFAVVLTAAAGRQRDLIVGEERIAEECAAIAEGVRDITACGGERRVSAAMDVHVDAQARAGLAVARMTAVRTLTLAAGAWLPLLLLLGAAPWLLRHGATAGTIVGALAYVMQGLNPALGALVAGVGGSGLRLAVTMMRIMETGAPPVSNRSATTGKVPLNGAAGSNGMTAACAAAAPAQEARINGTLAGSWPGSPRTTGPSSRQDAAVEMRGVTFAYGPHARPVIDGLDLVVPHGDHLTVVGPSGIGKSTLAALIAGLLEPDAGEIRVYGRPPGDVARRVFLPQDPYVFEGTLRENLVYLAPGTTDLELWDAVEALGMRRLVRRVGALDAALDPQGLSGGERQQIALARAYVAPMPVVVLDEATCELDATAEARAEAAFSRRPGTLILIAHRMASALRARRILVLDGTTARLGRHEDLLTTSPLYRDLVGHWRSQPSALLRDADGVHPVLSPDLVVDPGQVVAHRPDG